MDKNKLIPLYPVAPNIPISQGFWVRHAENPYYEWAYALFGGYHPGLDFSMKEGGNIYSTFEGVVVRREFHRGMGFTLGVRNGNIVSIYGHLKDFNVKLGQIVAAKEIVATEEEKLGATVLAYNYLWQISCSDDGGLVKAINLKE